jgi:hypothetical protein
MMQPGMSLLLQAAERLKKKKATVLALGFNAMMR